MPYLEVGPKKVSRPVDDWICRRY